MSSAKKNSKKQGPGDPPLGSSIPRKRTNTTLADKISILDYIKDNPKLSQNDVAAHFQKHGFPSMNQSTISRIAREEDQIRKDAKEPGNLAFKRPRVVEYPAVDAALSAWVLQSQTKGIRISAEVLREKARRFAQLQGIDPKEFLSLSNGWAESFKKRHSLKEYRFHGEAGSVVEDDVEIARVRIRKLTDQYALRDILNMDETGLNDRMPPDRGLATAQFAGRKADKHRLTYALTTNADGSESFPPLVIGHAKRPRCFQKKSGSALGFDYWWNKKAWMTASVFQGYLSNLDSKMRREKRKVLLLVDNAPSHIYDPKTLTNVRVEFLPPNMTSRIQPNDGGIIKAFKAHYKRLFCKRAIDREEAGEVDLYKIDQLQAMRLAQEAWDNVTKRTVFNCWRNVRILTPRGPDGKVLAEATEEAEGSPSNPDVEAAVAELDEAIRALAKKAIAPARVMRAQEMLDNDDGETEGTLGDEEIMEQVLRDHRADEAEQNGEEVVEDSDDDEPEPVITANEAKGYLRDLARFFDSRDEAEFRGASKIVPGLIRRLNLIEIAGKEQTKVTDFFYEWPASP